MAFFEKVVACVLVEIDKKTVGTVKCLRFKSDVKPMRTEERKKYLWKKLRHDAIFFFHLELKSNKTKFIGQVKIDLKPNY